MVRAVQVARVDEQTTGKRNGLHGLVRTVGVPPWWLRGPRSNPERFADVVGAPGAGSVVSCVLILGAVAIAGLVGLRRRRTDVVVAAALALVLAAAVAVVIASTPTRLIFSLEKVARLASPAGMFIWLVAAWSLATLAPRPRWRSDRPLVLVGAAATAIVAAIVATTQQPDDWETTYRPAEAVGSRVSAELSRDRTVFVLAVGGFPTFAFQTAMVYRLRRDGVTVVTGSNAELAAVRRLGPDYAPERHPPDDVLVIDDRQQPARFPRARVLARIRVEGEQASTTSRASLPFTITVTLVPSAELPRLRSIG